MDELPPAAPLQDHLRTRILSLTGGGIRGYFSARALQMLETEADTKIQDSFNTYSGTSIGGLIAIGLAVGISPETIATAIRQHGPTIFKKKWHRGLTNPWRLLRTAYPQKPLRDAVEAILGDKAKTKLGEVEVPLLVPALDFRRSAPRIFVSKPLAGADDDLEITLLDVALATSAAPTYFPPHRIRDGIFVDGGLLANSPDMIAAQRCSDSLGADWNGIRILSVGTAAFEATKDGQMKSPGAARWMSKHDLFGVTIDAQARLSLSYAKAQLGSRLYRLDESPSRPIALDDATDGALSDLEKAADRAVKRLKGDSQAWNAFLARRQRSQL
ncbi:CBASS cGAMP-activated phospholipase [Mesorhizobium calcicola]|uniref:CBASS cGAMP-activated phospholipase n=2 Tax=Mesorhizobium TaxID=68287 RepID=A0ABW4WE20_9HYPH|nr:CBASS cGAMP-activated phospholipase [Mesorhizobium sophorae]